MPQPASEPVMVRPSMRNSTPALAQLTVPLLLVTERPTARTPGPSSAPNSIGSLLPGLIPRGWPGRTSNVRLGPGLTVGRPVSVSIVVGSTVASIFLLSSARHALSPPALDLAALIVTEPAPQPCKRTHLSRITYWLYVPGGMVISEPAGVVDASITAWRLPPGATAMGAGLVTCTVRPTTVSFPLSARVMVSWPDGVLAGTSTTRMFASQLWPAAKARMALPRRPVPPC